MFKFGSGVMTVTPSGSNPTPINIGLLQEGEVAFQATNKQLFAQYRDPIAIGAGTRKWTGKAKVARFSARVLNALFVGGSITAGYTQTAYEIGQSGTSPYTYTTTNSANWTVDQGVIYAATGLPLKRVASGPAVGQYSVSAGVYTFASGDTSAQATGGLVVSYNYAVASGGSGLIIPQTLLGPTLSFALNFTAVDPTNNAQFTGVFNYCVAEKFQISTKLEDFAMPEFDFMLAANAAGSVGTFNYPDQF